jgi:hypothetical protein
MKEQVIAEIGLPAFVNVYRQRLTEPQLTDQERDQLQLALDIANEQSPFSVVHIVEDENGNQSVLFTPTKVGN